MVLGQNSGQNTKFKEMKTLLIDKFKNRVNMLNFSHLVFR